MDTNNYNTASCQVKITVNHTHNPKLVNGQAPQKGIAGWKDYYECICGERYEDASGSILIPDLAVWKAEGGNGYLAPLTPAKYTVTFNMGNHGTQIDPQTVEEGNNATKPSDPTAEGWTFGGWYVDTDFSAMFDFNTAINANTTIYAKWTENPVPQPVVYTIIVGAGSEWTKGETEGLLITSDAPFAKFSSVKVDESTIAATNYAAEEGSTKITLAPAYLETLSVGTHSIEIVSNSLTIYNIMIQKAAGIASQEILEELAVEIPKEESGFIDPNIDMPEKMADGGSYIATLSIPCLNLELPVNSEWSYDKMQSSPCRFSGSAYAHNLVICAHNYDIHFGNIKYLDVGDSVVLTDMDGNVFHYEIIGTETLGPYEMELMKSGDWALTLFTCTLGGEARITVRCELV